MKDFGQLENTRVKKFELDDMESNWKIYSSI